MGEVELRLQGWFLPMQVSNMRIAEFHLVSQCRFVNLTSDLALLNLYFTNFVKLSRWNGPIEANPSIWTTATFGIQRNNHNSVSGNCKIPSSWVWFGRKNCSDWCKHWWNCRCYYWFPKCFSKLFGLNFMYKTNFVSSMLQNLKKMKKLRWKKSRKLERRLFLPPW